MNIEKKNSNSSNVNGANVRWYQNDIMHMTPAENITITKIVFNCSSASYAKIAGVAENAAATGITTSGSTVTWEGSSDNELQFYATAQTRFSSIIITYTKAPEEAVEPTAIEFSLPQDVDYTSVQTVEISADGNDASGKAWPIYYNIDGGEATASDTPYTGPITVDRTMTINACVVGETKTIRASADYIVTIPKPSTPVISYNGTVIPNETEGYEIVEGSMLNIVSENATSIVITHESGSETTIEGSEKSPRKI